MADHTPEPWFTVFDRSVVGIDPAREDGEEYLAKIKGIPPARIVACVNACAGIPTEQIGELAPLLATANAIAEYYEKSVNVGPGNHPQREAILWADFRAALRTFRKD